MPSIENHVRFCVKEFGDMNKKNPLVFFVIALLMFTLPAIPSRPVRLLAQIIYYLSLPVFLYLFWKKKL